jgi:FkbM family methyltransferase
VRARLNQHIQGIDMASRKYLRFMWSHESRLHMRAVRIFNAIMHRVPFDLKYRIGRALRAQRAPYVLATPGSVVVQVGAPRDTLMSGRSRAFFFSLFVGPTGRAVVVEPDPESVAAFRESCARKGLSHVSVVDKAAWSESGTLDIYIDDEHPATNFTGAARSYDDDRMSRYRKITLPASTIDDILDELGLAKVDIVSITTNGAELEILRGMRRTLERGVRYIALAETGAVPDTVMSEFGFEPYAFDDRGRTFIRRDGSGAVAAAAVRA